MLGDSDMMLPFNQDDAGPLAGLYSLYDIFILENEI